MHSHLGDCVTKSLLFVFSNFLVDIWRFRLICVYHSQQRIKLFCCKQRCGSGMFIPDPKSDFSSRIPDPGSKGFPDPGSGFASKNLCILNPQKLFLSSRENMIRNVHPGCRIRILIFYPSRIRGSKRHRIPDSKQIYIQAVSWWSESHLKILKLFFRILSLPVLTQLNGNVTVLWHSESFRWSGIRWNYILHFPTII